MAPVQRVRRGCGESPQLDVRPIRRINARPRLQLPALLMLPCPSVRPVRPVRLCILRRIYNLFSPLLHALMYHVCNCALSAASAASAIIRQNCFQPHSLLAMTLLSSALQPFCFAPIIFLVHFLIFARVAGHLVDD